MFELLRFLHDSGSAGLVDALIFFIKAKAVASVIDACAFPLLMVGLLGAVFCNLFRKHS